MATTAASITAACLCVRLDGASFPFNWRARAHATYNLLTAGDLALHVALAGHSPYIYVHWLKQGAPAGAEFVCDEQGLRRLATPGGWVVDHWWKSNPDGQLVGVPHLEVYVVGRPARWADLGATGLLVDGTAEADPAAYEVAPPPGPAPAHD